LLVHLGTKSGGIFTTSDGGLSLWCATFDSRGRGDVIRLLLSKGADPDAVNDSGGSSRQHAERIGNYDVKQFFPQKQ
jgi:hypothetical protein